MQNTLASLETNAGGGTQNIGHMMEGEKELSKSQAKKADKVAQKQAKKEATRKAQEEQNLATKAVLEKVVNDIHTDSHGYLPFEWSAKVVSGSPREWTSLRQLNSSAVLGSDVWIRGRLQDTRVQGAFAFLTCRADCHTIQLVLNGKDILSKDAIKWAGSIPLESVIDVFGSVTCPEIPVKSTTIKVEIQVIKLFCVSKAALEMPFQLKDASRPDAPPKTSQEAPTEEWITVGQDVRLDNRILDLRTRANQAIFRIQADVCFLFREYLTEQHFIEIHSPKLIGGVSEGGANAFTLSYFGKNACLAQSPQLYKQMALCGDFDRVFEIGPVFRAENSNTHRHLCEFVGLDLEMTIKESYTEILDLVNELFKHIFEGLSTKCSKLISVVGEQFEASPFEWIADAPRIPYEEGVQMLRASGVKDIPEETSSYDLSTENEKILGKLVKDKYKTDFYMLVRYPLAVRPFYTMPDPTDQKWSNSYDIFMRGEEIISGAQRIHDPNVLIERAKAHDIDVSTIKSYIDAFRLGAYPHGGVGVGMERVVMLFLGLGNIRKTSLFPRDPKRLSP